MELLQQFQRLSHPVLDIVFTGITMLGEKVILAALFCLIYWCCDKRMGQFLIYSLTASICINGLVKDHFEAKRPFLEEGIVGKRVETATGHSFPSGHSQSAATFWWGAARWTSKGWLLAFAAALVLLVGISRLYLGVHYLRDVLAGLLLGILVSEGCHWLLVKKTMDKALLPVILLLALGALFFGESQDTLAAGAMGLAVFGGTWLENRFVGFSIPRGGKAKCLRMCAGSAIVGAAYLLPKLLIADKATTDILSISLVSLAAVFGAPWLFSRLRI